MRQFSRVLSLMLMGVLLCSQCYGGFGFCVDAAVKDYVPATVEVYVADNIDGLADVSIGLYDSSGNFLFGTNSIKPSDGTVESMTFSGASALSPGTAYSVVFYQDYYTGLYSESNDGNNLKNVSFTYSSRFDDPLEAGSLKNKKAFQFKVKNTAGQILMGISGSFVTTFGSNGGDNANCYTYRPGTYTCATL